jgi:hypothetical protein
VTLSPTAPQEHLQSVEFNCPSGALWPQASAQAGSVAYGRRSSSCAVEGQPPKSLPEGAAFFEPANTKIVHFDNASSRDPATFVAFYLLGKDDQKLIEMFE